jgi:uncharacterized phage protein (TIGR01671 family)
MREYKFRAWDKEESEMLQVDCIDFFKKEILDQRNDIHSFENIELMQYTGLTDKNGKEIYEGDVLEDITTSDRYEIVYIVNTASYEMKAYSGRLERMDIDDIMFYEIIGNIYEHSHLLDNN